MMEKLISKLKKDYPNLAFKTSTIASWSPSKRVVSYSPIHEDINKWALLHELGHALLDHQSSSSDLDLLLKESAAWSKAQDLAQRYNMIISQDHIQSCLDTYRDWLHKRSACPKCHSLGLQSLNHLYVCVNCRSKWKVCTDRLCRPYRLNAT